MSHNSSAPPPSLSPTASRHREWKLGCKVYVGNLVDGASKSDIEEAFNKYGPLRSVWVARNPSGFAFVEFEDGRDAEDACRHLDGTRIAGGRIKAEMSHGRTRRGRGGGGSGGPPSFRAGPPPFHSPYPMNGHSYHGHPFRGPYQGPPPPRGGAGYYSNGDYHDSYVNSHHHPSLPPPRHHSHSNHSHHNNNHHHHHSSHHSGSSGYRGPPPPSEPPMHHGYSERLSRHVPKPRSPLGGKDAYRYSRSRSNSLGKSPPPPPQPPTQPTSQHQQEQQEQLQPSPLAQSQPPGSASPPSPSARTAQPRTPPSESDF